jgi:hypothetical protein
MEKMESLIRYLISPIAFVLLFGASLLVGSMFMMIGAFSYIKLLIADQSARFS